MTRKVDLIGSFFEQHVLGLVAHLSDAINDPQPVMETKRCLGAIREMILLGKGHVSNGLPQV